MATPADSFNSEVKDFGWVIYSELPCQSVVGLDSYHGSKVVCGDIFSNFDLYACSKKSNDLHILSWESGCEHCIYFHLFPKNTGQQLSKTLYFPLTQQKDVRPPCPSSCESNKNL